MDGWSFSRYMSWNVTQCCFMNNRYTLYTVYQHLVHRSMQGWSNSTGRSRRKSALLGGEYLAGFIRGDYRRSVTAPLRLPSPTRSLLSQDAAAASGCRLHHLWLQSAQNSLVEWWREQRDKEQRLQRESDMRGRGVEVPAGQSNYWTYSWSTWFGKWKIMRVN